MLDLKEQFSFNIGIYLYLILDCFPTLLITLSYPNLTLSLASVLSSFSYLATFMLQSTFNVIKQHFSPQPPIDKNIFITQDHDYPSPFVQKLYLSYLQLQLTLNTRSTQEIAKRINIVTNKNDKLFEATILAFVYAILLHSPRAQQSHEPLQKQKPNLLDSTHDTKLHSQKILSQLTYYFPSFRNQTWSLFTHIALELLLNHFLSIKPLHRFGFITILNIMQKFSLCQDDYFIAIMKTLNFYDHKNSSLKYSLELMAELGQIINRFKKSTQISTVSPDEIQKNFSKIKANEQMSLMRHYLFGKLLHWQHMAHKMSAYLKGEWPLNLERTCTESLKILKALYQLGPEECLVFSGQFVRYADFPTQDFEMKEILLRVSESSQKAVSEQLIGHHFSLVPIATEFLIPFQIEQQINQMARTLYEMPQQSAAFSRVEKHNIHMIMEWEWKQCIKQFSEQNNKNYLIENAYQDLVRWCLMSHTKNLELRSFIIEWVMYSAGHNEALSRTVKEAFFWDWLFYLKVAQQIELNAIFGILTSSIHILNYFAFCAPNLAEGLLVFILGKGIFMKTQYQTGSTAEGMFRVYINEVLKRASREGILRIRQILYQSQLSNLIKTELELRIQQGESSGIEPSIKELKQGKMDNSMIPQNIYAGSGSGQSIIEQRNITVEKPKYYGQKQFDIPFDMNERGFGNEMEHSDEDDVIYTSHELIPASPSYQEQAEPNYADEEICHNNVGSFSLQDNAQNSFGVKDDLSLQFNHLEREFHGKPQTLQITQKPTEKVRFDPTSPSVNPNITKPFQTYQVKLQKEFLEEMGPSINLLLLSPTVIQFTEYMKDLIKVLKEYKKSSQEEMIEKFMQQTSKILYLAFNKEFESFDFGTEDSKSPKDSRYLPYFLLKSIHQNWKQSLVVYNIFVYKKLVKYLCEAFPSAELTFYYVFLDIFKKGVVHFKEMKNWLFVSENQKIVVPVLQQLLGNNFKLHIYENAQVLKIV